MARLRNGLQLILQVSVAVSQNFAFFNFIHFSLMKTNPYKYVN